jgi:hypothetical protein
MQRITLYRSNLKIRESEISNHRSEIRHKKPGSPPMPIPFTCPHCGAQTQVDERYAGQTGPCARCGQPITVPGPGPAAAAYAPPAAKKSSTVPILIGVLAAVVLGGMCLVGILVALLLPAVQAAREAARRSSCQNNLKQIALALHNYNDVYGSLPPAYVADENGKPMHSWRVLILPFLEQQALYDQYKFDEPWDGPNNSRLAQTIVSVYGCPSEGQLSANTSYVAVVGPNTAFQGDQPVKFRDITDGLSNTLMVIDAANTGINWMEPRDLDMTSVFSATGRHPKVINVMMGDGSVRSIPVGDPNLQAMLTINGGEMAP